jgi:hypothetical protein
LPKLTKNTLSLTFKFDCDRFLRFRLAPEAEKSGLGIENDVYKRPGIELVRAAGRRWETDKYQDLIDVSGAGATEYRLEPTENVLAGRRLFDKVDNLFEILRRPDLPLAIMEGEFEVPTKVTPGLQQAYDRYRLDRVSARPDILWIRRAPTGAPLIGARTSPPEYEIHIVDVKMAAEPSLRHFTEVTYYALALAAALEEQGLSERFAVSAEGFIWPGSYDANAFRNLHRDLVAKGDGDPVTKALLQTLIAVPYEVYQVHVKQFFEERLLRVLGQAPLDASWHVCGRCQLCDYLLYCREQAGATDHLSRVPWLNRGQGDLLRSNGMGTTRELAVAVEAGALQWQQSVATSPQLRADGPAILARVRALQSGAPEIVAGRKCPSMPAWSDMNIYVTVHFDPGSGIAFALGAKRVFFPPGRTPGSPPIRDGEVYVVDRVDNLNPESERRRLLEFVRLVAGWLEEAHRANEAIRADRIRRGERDSDFGKVKVHVFVWDKLEVDQFRRMLERHMEEAGEAVDLLVRMFPPENVVPDPDYFRAQPGTVVKEAVRLLAGLPIPHEYSLLEVANVFYPRTLPDGRAYRFMVPFGFWTPMSDQIPFERAYELWEDRIFLRRFQKDMPPERWPLYSRPEIYDGIRKAADTRLEALRHVVEKLRENHRDLLVLKKPAFSAAPPVQIAVPEKARKLNNFEKLNVVCAELKDRQNRYLPVDEREARFISIRGLAPATGSEYDRAIADVRARQPRYATRDLLAFTLSPASRDARVQEGQFTLALSNEEDGLNIDVPWRVYLGLSQRDAAALVGDNWGLAKSPLKKLLKVDLVKIEAIKDPPYLIVSPADTALFGFAQTRGLLDLNRPLILDPFFEDFTSDRVEKTLRAVGGDPPPRRRRRRTS